MFALPIFHTSGTTSQHCKLKVALLCRYSGLWNFDPKAKAQRIQVFLQLLELILNSTRVMSTRVACSAMVALFSVHIKHAPTTQISNHNDKIPFTYTKRASFT